MINWMPFIGPYFQVNIPTNWKVVSSAYFQVTFLSPPMRDGHHINIAVMIFPLQDDLSTYIKQTFIPSIDRIETVLEKDVREIVAQSGEIGFDIRVKHQLENESILQRHVIFEYQDVFYQFLATTRLNLDGDLQIRIDEVFDLFFDSIIFTKDNLEEALGFTEDLML